MQKLQRRNFRLNIETAQGKGDSSVLEKSLLDFRLLNLPKARHIVQDLVKGTPYHPQTNQLCAKKEHFLHIIALFLVSEALPEPEGDEEAHPPKASAVQLSILEDLSTTSSFRVSESIKSSKNEPQGEEEENDE